MCATTTITTAHVDLILEQVLRKTVKEFTAEVGKASTEKLMDRLSTSDSWDAYAAECADVAGRIVRYREEQTFRHPAGSAVSVDGRRNQPIDPPSTDWPQLSAAAPRSCARAPRTAQRSCRATSLPRAIHGRRDSVLAVDEDPG